MSGSDVAVARRPLPLGLVATRRTGEAPLLDANGPHHWIRALALERQRSIAGGAGVGIASGISIALECCEPCFERGHPPRQFAKGFPLRDLVEESENV